MTMHQQAQDHLRQFVEQIERLVDHRVETIKNLKIEKDLALDDPKNNEVVEEEEAA